MKPLERLIENRIVRSMDNFPVVYINGPRQSGKTTLVQHIAATKHPATYVTFDDIQMRSAAQQDPDAFLRGFEGSVILDEIQMVPELFRSLKIIVDQNRRKKKSPKFLLTGSASIMALPQLSDALVGRMVLHTLLPFCVSEVQKQKKQPINFIDYAFSKQHTFHQSPNNDLTSMMSRASFPELLTMKNETCTAWCNGYINTILQRDVHALMKIEKIGYLPDMLRLLATRTGSLLHEANLSRDTGLNHITAKRYRLLLEHLFLTKTIPAWSVNLGKRLIKSPKVYINDINLLCYLLNTDLYQLPKENPMLFGQVLENFVAIELTKQLTFSETNAELYHYRSISGQEVDFILSGPHNRIVAVKVKKHSKVTANDFRHLNTLKDELGHHFHAGFVFYTGTDFVPLGKDLWATPLSMLNSTTI